MAQEYQRANTPDEVQKRLHLFRLIVERSPGAEAETPSPPLSPEPRQRIG
jgi:hypothetical protein